MKYFKKILCYALIFMILISIGRPAAWGADFKTVRVGYFSKLGYHEIDKNGKKSGYGYEYLHEIAKYTNWKYEYVYATYTECLKMLKNGEIDMLTPVAYDEERDKIYGFSSLPMGTRTNLLTVKATNTKYTSGEYDEFNGIRIGMLKKDISDIKLKEFSEKNKFTYIKNDSYNSLEELLLALKNNEIDAVLSNNFRVLQNERIIAEFSPDSYYATVNKNNNVLLEELNYAMERLDIENPAFKNTIYEKYYYNNNYNGVVFSQEEKEYLKENKNIEMILLPTLEPLVSTQNSKIDGIAPQIIRKALEPAGLNIKLVTFDTRSEYEQYRINNSSAVMGMMNKNIYYSEIENMKITNSYLQLSYCAVSLQEKKTADDMVMACIKGTILDENYVKKHYKQDHIKYYNSYEECLEAVKNGEASCTIINSYNTEKIIYDDISDNFVSNTVMGFTTDLVIGVSNDVDPRLFSIINKCVNALSEDDKRTIVLNNTLYKDKKLTIKELLYKYPERIFAILLLLFISIIGYVVWIAQHKRIVKERKLHIELIRFASMAYQVNGDVKELNLNDKKQTNYSIENNKLNIYKESFSYDNIVEQEINAIIHNDDYKIAQEAFSQANLEEIADNMQEKFYEIRIQNYEKQKYYWVLVTILGLPKNNLYPRNIMIFIKDIDGIKMKEEEKHQQIIEALNIAEVANKTKNDFMSKMSHEIRTPLNAVLGYIAIAKKYYLDLDKIKDCINKSEIAAKHLLDLVNDVLDMSSIESGKMKLSNESFNIKELILSTSALFQNQAYQNNIQYDVKLNNITDENLYGDHFRLNQILINLLSNAIKFTSLNGHVAINVTQKKVSPDRVNMEFVISDDGIGIDDEFLTRLYTPFEQQDVSISRNYGGTGLGLSITSNLVLLMQGNIKVKSKKNIGSTFIVELSFTVDNSIVEKDAIAEIQEVDIEQYNFTGKKILIAEDNEMNMEIAVDILRLHGFTVECAENGKQAYDMFIASENNYYDAVILDIQMPIMDGYDTIINIRNSCHLDAKGIPIIAMTANAFQEDVAKAYLCGFTDYISKPIDIDGLILTLAKYIKIDSI